jgi:tetratricopeptide (TPR) repeat protein
MLDEATTLDLASSNSTVQANANTAEDYYLDANVKYYELQDARGGLSSYDRAIELDPNHALAYSNRGNIKKDRLQDYQGALSDYDRALSLDSNDAITYYNRALLKNIKQDYQGSLADYDRSIELADDDADSYNNRAMLKYLELEDLVGAISDMQIARSLYQQQGNDARSIQAIELISRFQSKVDSSGLQVDFLKMRWRSLCWTRESIEED